MSCAATKEKAASSGMSARMVMKARAAARCGMPSSADRSSTRRRKVCASPSRRLQAALASPSGSSRARTRRSRLITARITRRREARARLLLPRPGELSAGECDGREKDARRGGGESQRGRGGPPRAADRGGARRGAALPARGRGDEARGRARLAGRQAEGGGRGAPAPPGVRPGQQDGRHRGRGRGRLRARQPRQVAGHRGRRRVPRRPALPPLGRRLAEGPPLFLTLMAERHFADGLLDELLPESLDWRHLVRKYPHAAIATAAVAGFWLGRTRGTLLVSALGAYLASELGETVSELIGD